MGSHILTFVTSIATEDPSMKLYQVGFVVAAMAAGVVASFSTACSSSSSGGSFGQGDGGSGGSSGSSSGGTNVIGTGCIYTGTAGMECTLYTNLTTSQQSGLNNECTGAKGQTVMTCPTTNEVGCCAYTASGFQTNSCYYSGTVSSLEASCTSSMYMGTWTTGSGSSGDE
jgi:hypothetical protein